jgi:peroxiredoxin Q/BCP
MQKRNRFWWVIPFTVGILLWGVWSFVFSSTPLKEGSKAPDFTLVGSDGNTYRLSDHRGKRVVLMFYPKSNTPGCTAQNCSIRDQYEKLSQYAVVFGISVDTPEAQANFAKQHNLKHIVLADTDGKVAEAYQVRTGAGFASRTTFVIAPDGTIEKVFEKAGTSNHADELLAYFTSTSAQNGAAAPQAAEKPEIGKRVPNFTLPNVNPREGAAQRGHPLRHQGQKSHRDYVHRHALPRLAGLRRAHGEPRQRVYAQGRDVYRHQRQQHRACL